MQQQGILAPNSDPGMQPYVILNRGPWPLVFKSILEQKRWDLYEHDEDREIRVNVGQRKIVPHDYYEVYVDGPGESKADKLFGDAAPQLKGYKKAYRIRMVTKPFWKKLTDYITNG